MFDQKIFENIQNVFSTTGIKSAFLVAGGFHSPGILDQFRKHKIPYVLVTPQISDQNNFARYFARIAGRRAAIEEFKSKHPNLASASSYAAPVAVLNPAEIDAIRGSFDLTIPTRAEVRRVSKKIESWSWRKYCKSDSFIFHFASCLWCLSYFYKQPRYPT